MYDPPAYLWALIIAGTSAIAVATCVALYGGAMRAGLGRRHAALLTVPLLFAVHITSVSALARAPRILLPARAPLAAAAE